MYLSGKQPPMTHGGCGNYRNSSIGYLRLIFILMLFSSLFGTAIAGSLAPSSRHDAAPKTMMFNLVSNGCMQPGEIFKLTGDQLLGLADYRLVLKAEKQFIDLKLLSISQQQILVQLPRDTALKPDQHYPLLLLPATGTTSQDTGMMLKICPTVTERKLLPVREIHQSGEILVLASSGLIDQIINEGSKLGYLLLRRYQLNSINQTLLVLGGADKKLDKTLEILAATFPDAAVDYNHLYDSNAFSLPATDEPDTTGCSTRYDTLPGIGLAGGAIDMKHPALAGRSIKIKNFLQPDQQPDKNHATASAVLLVGRQSEADIEGLAPFSELKVANIIQKGSSVDVATAESVSRALDWFINEKARLLIISLTSPHTNKITNTLFARAANRELIIFAAARPENESTNPAFPATTPGVISVDTGNASGKALLTANQGEQVFFSSFSETTPGSAKKTRPNKASVTYAALYAVALAAHYLAQQPDMTRENLLAALQQRAITMAGQNPVQPGHNTYRALCYP